MQFTSPHKLQKKRPKYVGCLIMMRLFWGHWDKDPIGLVGTGGRCQKRLLSIP